MIIAPIKALKMPTLRYSVEESPSSIKITILPHRQWFAIGLMTVVFFAFLFTFVPDIMSSFARERQASPFGEALAVLVYTLLAIALLTWSLDLLWQIKGREVVEITRDSLTLLHLAGSFKVSRKCELIKIEQLSILPLKSKHARPAFFSTQEFLFLNFGYGRLELSYDRNRNGNEKVIRFGSALKEIEVHKLAALIRKCLE